MTCRLRFVDAREELEAMEEELTVLMVAWAGFGGDISTTCLRFRERLKSIREALEGHDRG